VRDQVSHLYKYKKFIYSFFAQSVLNEHMLQTGRLAGM